jgi:hypothetical protein
MTTTPQTDVVVEGEGPLRQKKVRRKVTKAECTHGRVPGWLLDLECGHFTEIMGWGDGCGIAQPKTTICPICSTNKESQ